MKRAKEAQEPGSAGGSRKTSPCTSFHPVSSARSSSVSSLYAEISRFSARMMISPTMNESMSTMSTELVIENQ